MLLAVLLALPAMIGIGAAPLVRADDTGESAAADPGWQTEPQDAYPAPYRRGTQGVLEWSDIRLDEGWPRSGFAYLAWGDDAWLVSVGRDGMMTRWDAKTGRGTHARFSHTKSCEVVRVSPDGAFIATYGYDQDGGRGILRLWDARTGKLALEAKRLHLSDIAFSPDSKYVLGASFSDRVYLWELASPETPRVVPVHVEGSPGPSCVAMAPDGSWIAVGDQKGQVQVVDLASGEVKHRLAGGPDYLLDVDISADGRWIVTVDQDVGGKVWDAATGTLHASLETPNLGGRWADISSDGRHVAIGSMARVAVWDLAAGKVVRTTGDAGGSVGEFSPDGSWLALDGGRHVRILDADSLEERALRRARRTGALSAIGGGGAWMAGGPFDGRLQVWDVDTEKVRCAFEPPGSIESLAASASGNRIACAGGFGEIDVYDVRRKRHLCSLKPAFGRRRGLEHYAVLGLSENGKLLATMRWSGSGLHGGVESLGICSVRTATLVRSHEGPWKYRPVLGPKFEIGLFLTGENEMSLLDVERGDVLHTFEGGPPAAFSPKADWAVVGVEDAYLGFFGRAPWVPGVTGEGALVTQYVDGPPARIWSVRTGEALRDLAKGPAVVSTFAVSTDGAWVAALGRSLVGERGDASYDDPQGNQIERSTLGPPRLWLWDAKTGALVDDIALPRADSRAPPGGWAWPQLVVGKKRILVASAGDLLVYDIDH
jgi:WD40 repeat protein